MGHIRLSISDIEFVGTEEYLLDDDDVILLEEPRPAARTRASVRTHRPKAALPAPQRRFFDDAQTGVWSRAALAR